ncbi:sensor histidine kinase [Streptosporangium saharense]|uniref:sensor histidine kinase n=1 Tax=Streptosporangium saharense TaxID=1706840 RepID=UPI00342B8A73
MTEHTPQDCRPRGSLVAAAAALSRLGRLRDLPVILMLAWVGWLAIPWPSSGLTQARGVTTGVQGTDAPAVRPAAAGTTWTLAAAPAPSPTPLVKPAAPALLVEPAVPAPHPPASVPLGPEASGTDVAGLIAEERARIAGEVHDAAGHGLATIAMQAGLALLVFDEHPDQVRASLEAIRATSTRALGQLRSALDLVEEGPDPAGHDLSGLVAGVRAAGLAVTVEPARPDVPAHLEDVVYRVVRESLTNVLRHAGPTPATVRLAHDRDGLRVEVLDRGSGTAGTPVEGRGLAGMRVRVTEVGGSFEAGPREDGGFRVAAHFPPRTV